MAKQRSSKPRSRTRLYLLCAVLVGLLGYYVPYRKERLNEELLTAVAAGEAAVVHRALDAGADPNSRRPPVLRSVRSRSFVDWLRSLFQHNSANGQSNGRSALMMAASQGKLPIVKDLLAHGAKPNLKLDNGVTALYLAGRGTPEVVEVLLRAGADRTARGPEGMTVLHVAAVNGRTHVLMLLLDRGANVNEPAAQGYTPLHIAAVFNQGAAAELLLDRGGDIRILNRLRSGPLLWAASTGTPELIRRVWKEWPPDPARTNMGNSALISAIHSMNPAAVQTILDLGVTVNPPIGGAPVPLHAAAAAGNIKMVRLLLARGASVNARNIAGRTALMETAQSSVGRPVSASMVTSEPAERTVIAKELLAHGADVHIVSRSRETVLFAAQNDAELTRIFLDKGADPNATDLIGKTPLLATINADVIRVLIEHGANVNVSARSGETPLVRAVRIGRVETVRLLVEHGVNINTVDHTGQTAFSYASNTRNTRIAELLQKAGAK